MIPDLTPPTQTSIRKPRASGDDPVRLTRDYHGNQ